MRAVTFYYTVRFIISIDAFIMIGYSILRKDEKDDTISNSTKDIRSIILDRLKIQTPGWNEMSITVAYYCTYKHENTKYSRLMNMPSVKV